LNKIKRFVFNSKQLCKRIHVQLYDEKIKNNHFNKM